MPHSTEKTKKFFNAIPEAQKLIQLIKSKQGGDLEPERVPLGNNAEETADRLAFLAEKGIKLPLLSGKQPIQMPELDGNIENYIGNTVVPTGVIGPLHILGSMAKGDFFVPMATTEGALIASYDRGARATRLAGGITSVCVSEGVQRSPVFKFKNTGELGTFLLYVLEQTAFLQEIVSQGSRFAKLQDLKATVEGNHLILTLEFTTGDAAGQNMVTLAADAICKHLLTHAPLQPEFWFIESNYSGDKKATSLSFTNVRGKKVVAEVHLPEEVVTKSLRTTAKAMQQYWLSSTMGVVQSGAIGAQGHIANGLCAVFMATGQDVACVAEAAVGVTRMELLPDNGLYVSVTMPNLIVGSVGGGTWLPTQAECLRMIGCEGAGHVRKLAEICAAVAVAGEISIAAALSAGHFAAAHQKFGRKR